MGFHLRTVLIGLCLGATVIGVSAESIKRPTTAICNKQKTLFKVKHIYHFAYTMTTSSGYVGMSPWRSGSKLSCTVILEVPRKCEIILKLRKCSLQSVDNESQEGYSDVNDVDFIQQLQRYPLYFQLSEGKLIQNTIVSDNRDTVAILNIKRGIISAIQFDTNLPKKLDNQEVKKEITDVYGTCTTSYVYDPEDPSLIITLRDLRKCQLHQIFFTQFPTLTTPIRILAGGILQDQIKENIYPFDTRVSCKHTVGDKMSSTCTHQHYFKPTAFVDENQKIHTAMTTISQTVEMVKVDFKGQRQPDRKLDGRKIIDIGFDFGDQTDDVELSQLEHAAAELKNEYTSTDFEVLPSAFEGLVFLMRKSSKDVLHSFMGVIFSCNDDQCSKEDEAMKTFYLDGLQACGTVNCHIQVFDCLNMGHLNKYRSSEFMYGLAAVAPIDEAIQLKMFEYCKKSGTMRCWLPLGTIISKTPVTDTKFKPDSVMGQTVAYIREELRQHCSAEKMDVTARHLITAVKTLGNIGFKKVKESLEDGFINLYPYMKECLFNKVIPDSVNYVILQELSEDASIRGYTDQHPFDVADLFAILNDDSRHNNLRTMSFSILSRTSDSDVIGQLLNKMEAEDTAQLNTFMVNTVHMLYETDQPELQHVREAWQKQPHPPRIWDRSKPGKSKPIYMGHFFKIPVTEYFGGHLGMDLIFDEADTQISSLSVQLNYYYDNTRYNIFQFTMNTHGLDRMLALLDVKPEELVEVYTKLSQGDLPNGSEFPKFQQHLLKKVMKMLDRVNYPMALDFDVFFDVKAYGKNQVFISLQEVKSLYSEMSSQNPGGTQKFLGRLMKSIEKDIFKAVELLSIVKVIPTCGGVPLNMSVKASGWNMLKNTFKSNLAMVLGGKSKDFTFGWKQYVLFNAVVSGEAFIPIGNAHISGLRGSMRMGSERDIQADITVGCKEDGTPKFNLDFAPISEGKTSEKLLYVRGMYYVRHNNKWDEIQADKAVQTTYNRCLDADFQMAVGRSVCVTFDYAKVAESASHPHFPLSGPFDMEVVMQKVDNVDLYHVSMGFTNNKDTYHLHLQNSAEGISMNRLSSFDFKADKKDRTVTVDIVAAELDIEYHMVFDAYRSEEFQISEFLYKAGELLAGYRLQGIKDREKDSRSLNFNLTLPGVSWDWEITEPNTYRQHYKHVKVVYNFYCSQNRPLLYLFHLSPFHALENGDRTVVTFDITYSKEERYVSMSLELPADTLAVYVKEDGGDVTFSPSYTSYADGTPKELSVKVIFEMSGVLSVLRAKSIEVNGKDYGVDVTGTIEGSLFDYEINLQAKYDKDKVKPRNRRDLALFERMRSLESSVLNRFYQIEESIRGKRSPDNKGYLASIDETLLPVVPSFPSIWDVENWDSNLKLHGKIVTSQEPRDLYPSAAVELHLSFQHPWNGGFRDVQALHVFGMGQRPRLRNFKFWTSANGNMTYMNSDGSPILNEEGEPLVFHADGEIHINRQSGSLFDFGMHFNDPHALNKYEIMFDWDASSHNDPLIRVSSESKNEYMPFFDHQYEETLSLEKQHLIHSLDFSHKILKYKMTTDAWVTRNPNRKNRSKEEYIIEQTGSYGSPMFYPDWTISFTGTMKNLDVSPFAVNYVLEYQDSLIPDKVFVNTYYIKPKEFGLIIGEKKTPAADMLTVRTYKYHILETRIKLVLTWPIDTKADTTQVLKDRILYPGMLLKRYADKILSDMSLNILHQPFFLSSLTLDDIAANMLEPHLKSRGQAYVNFVANFVPQDQREEVLKKPNRVTIVFNLLERLKNQEKIRAVQHIQQINYLAVNSLSKFALMRGYWLVQSQKFADVMEEREAVYSFTIPFVITYRESGYVQDIERREIVKHLTAKIKEKRSTKKTTDSNFGVIFKHKGSNMGLNIKTFNGYVYSIPVSEAAKGTYLLAADLLKRQYSLVVSPHGINLISKKGSVTIGFDNDIFINDCRKPSSEIPQQLGDGAITVERQDEETHIETEFGISITCDMSWSKICFIGLKKSNRNTTIGLLGTNNEGSFYDRRGVAGNVLRDDAVFVLDYCLSGCDNLITFPPESESCVKEGINTCEAQMNDYRYTYTECTQVVGNIFFLLRDVCKENAGCGVDPDSPCLLIKSFRSFCQRQGLITSVSKYRNKEVICLAEPPYNWELAILDMKKSLDVVLVVSLHEKTASKLVQAPGYIQETIQHLLMGQSFIDQRISVIVFGGHQKDPHYAAIQTELGEERYFTEMNEFHFFELLDLGQFGSEDPGVNAFKALEMAAQSPFHAGANKMIVLLTSKDGDASTYNNINTLKEELIDEGISLHVFSTYKLGQGVIGVTHEGKEITKYRGPARQSAHLPQNDFGELVKSTGGSMFDIDAINWYTDRELLVPHLQNVEVDKSQQSCPAA